MGSAPDVQLSLARALCLLCLVCVHSTGDITHQSFINFITSAEQLFGNRLRQLWNMTLGTEHSACEQFRWEKDGVTVLKLEEACLWAIFALFRLLIDHRELFNI